MLWLKRFALAVVVALTAVVVVPVVSADDVQAEHCSVIVEIIQVPHMHVTTNGFWGIHIHWVRTVGCYPLPHPGPSTA